MNFLVVTKIKHGNKRFVIKSDLFNFILFPQKCSFGSPPPENPPKFVHTVPHLSARWQTSRRTPRKVELCLNRWRLLASGKVYTSVWNTRRVWVRILRNTWIFVMSQNENKRWICWFKWKTQNRVRFTPLLKHKLPIQKKWIVDVILGCNSYNVVC